MRGPLSIHAELPSCISGSSRFSSTELTPLSLVLIQGLSAGAFPLFYAGRGRARVRGSFPSPSATRRGAGRVWPVRPGLGLTGRDRSARLGLAGGDGKDSNSPQPPSGRGRGRDVAVPLTRGPAGGRRSGHRPGGGARSLRPVSRNHTVAPVTMAGSAGWPGMARNTARDTAAAMAPPDDQPQRPSVPDPFGDHQHGVQPGQGRGGPGAGSGGGHRRGAGGLAVEAAGVVGEVGVGFAASPGGAELGVGGGGGGVPGEVAAVGPVGVGGGGYLSP